MAGASDYMVGNAPQGASYAAPLVGAQLGQQIASLPDSYMKGRENRRTMALQDAFQNGVPQNPDGSPDINAINNTMARLGGGQYVQGMMPFLLNMEQGKRFASGMQSADAFVAGGAPAAASSASGPANLQPRSQTSTPQGPQGGRAPQAAQGVAEQAEASQPTVMKILAAQGIPNDQLGAAAASISRQLGVNPTDPIDTTDPRISNVLGPAITQLKRAGLGQVQPPQPGDNAPQQQPTRVAAAGGPPFAPGGTGAPSTAQAAPGSTAPIQPRPVQTQPVAAPGRRAPPPSPDDVADVPGMDVETAKRLQGAEAYVRTMAASIAANNPAQAQALEKTADSYAARRTQIMEYLSKGAQAEHESALRVQEQAAAIPNESKVARDPAVTQFELTKAQNANDVDRFGKQADAIDAVGSKAPDAMQNIKLAQRETLSPDFSAGTFRVGTDAWKRLVSAVGANPNAATPSEVFDKVRAGNILDQIKGMAGTGPVRVAEMKFIDTMVANRDNSVPALRTLLEIQRREWQRSQDIQQLKLDYKDGHIDNGFKKIVNQYVSSHPMFSDDEMKHPNLLSLPTFNDPSEIPPTFPKGASFRNAKGDVFQNRPRTAQGGTQ